MKAPLVSAKAWQNVFDHLKVDTKPSGTVVLPDIAFVKVNVDELLIDNFNQTNLSLLARPSGNSLLVTMNSNEMNANLEWKKGQNGKEPELIAHISKPSSRAQPETLLRNPNRYKFRAAGLRSTRSSMI